MIQLDTSFLIRALVRGTAEDKRLRGWLKAGTPIAVSALAWAEFLCGPISTETIALARELFDEPTPFGTAEAELAASLFNQSGRRRGTLVDCMIAATAIRSSLPLATSNTADFERFVPLGLRLA